MFVKNRHWNGSMGFDETFRVHSECLDLFVSFILKGSVDKFKKNS